MKLLFITNSILPAPSNALGQLDTITEGNLVFALAKQLILNEEIKLCIATVYDGGEIKVYNIDGIKYYLLPSKSKTTYQKKLETYWQIVYKDFTPDIIHIHGTEYLHGLAFMRIYPDLNYIVSVQGIIGAISRYYFSNISLWEIFRHLTFRDIVKRDSIIQAKKRFENRSILEKEYFIKSNHVIGRTSWDFVHAKILNPQINYHFCNESLSDGFYYSQAWNLNKKTSYTIFLSQSYYPIKGLHQVLRAIAILKTDFPEIKLRVAGTEILIINNLQGKIRLSGYGSYIRGLIRKYKLDENVVFTGRLNEVLMISEYINAHLFICPSSIENSPNSLGEAQILGVPVIASYVGGIPDMITHEKSGLLYRFEEFEMLAYNIRRIFEDNKLAFRLSEGGRAAALERHDRKKNADMMVSIYRKVIK